MLLDSLLSFLAPYECLGCSAEGRLICRTCLTYLKSVPERCYRCHAFSPGSLTCRKCKKTSRLTRVQVLTTYEGIAKELIWKLKFDGAQSAAIEIANLFPNLQDDILLIPAPTATTRVRQRGYDQAVLLAKALSRKYSATMSQSLVRTGQAHQRGASRQQRLKQLESVFRVKQVSKLTGAHVVLVDDVLTTGATLEAAAKVLRQAGVDRIDAVVFAQV